MDLPTPNRAAYLLDFDGTLVDIAPAPDLVRVDPQLPISLRRLRLLCGDAVAIVTGRPIAQVDALLPDTAYAIAGEHGTALRTSPDAEIVVSVLPPLPPLWLERAASLAAGHPGAMVEHKRHGFVLHYRGAPDAAVQLRTGVEQLLAGVSGYELMAAKMAWEVRPAGIDKGSAVLALMRRPPFVGRLPIYVGDDVTDEDGMAAARALGGVGLQVDEAFGSPEGVRRWLDEISQAVLS